MTQPRESTPQGPGGGNEPEREQNGEDGTPDGPQPSSATPKLVPDGAPPEGPRDRTAPGTAADRWGDLPQHARDVFRTQGGADLPVRYRDWIDAYYKRLNRTQR